MGTITTLNNINYDTFTSMIEGYANASGVEASFTTQGTNVTVTLIGENGEPVQMTVALPEIDNPDATDTTDVFTKLMDNLEGSVKEANATTTANTTSESKATKSNSVFIDIFKLMALLQEIAQTQKETAATMRAAGHQANAANLQAQADEIRSAQAISSKFGYAAAITSAVMTGASAVMAGIGIGKQVNAYKNSGVGTSVSNLNAGEADLKAVTQVQNDATVKTPETIVNEAIADPDSPYHNSTPEQVKADLFPTASQSEGEMVTAKGNLEAAQTKLQTAEGETQSAKLQLDDANQKLTTFNTEHPVDENGNYVNVEDQNNAAELNTQKAQLETNVSDAQKTYDAKLSTENSCRENVQTCNEKYVEACGKFHNDMKQDVATWEKAVADSNAAVKAASTPEEKTNAEQSLKDNKYKLSMAKQMQKAEDKAMGPELVTACKAEVANLQRTFDTKFQAFQGGSTKGRGLESLGNICKQLGDVVSQFLNIEVQEAQSESQAKQKELEAQKETRAAETESMSDLSTEAQSLFDAVKSLLKAIMEAEAQAAAAARNI